MRRRNLVLLSVLALLVSVTALPALARAVHVSGNPEVQILAPQGGQSVSSLGVRLQISVTNFSLDGAAIGGTNEANHGHYHVYVNDTFTGLLTADPIVDVSTFPVGPMKLGVQLVNNDHSSLSPQVWHNITVTVVAPSIDFVHPAAGGTVSTAGARFQVDVQGFELDVENYNGNPIPGHGHYHAFVDGSLVGTPTVPFFDVASLAPGPHNITVDLRTNNHQLLSPTAEALLMVTAVDPSLTIDAPANNAQVSTEGFQLDVYISGWELDGENYNGNPIPGHGHYHVFVDGNLAGTPTTPSFAIGALTEGAHTITADLRTNDHQLLSPTVEATIDVTAVTPAISIMNPANNSAVSMEGFQLNVAIAGWELDGENYNGNPIPGHGHYHVFVDGNLAGTPTTPSSEIGPLTAGDHTISVDLRTNNHQLLSPTAEASITVTAVAPSISIVAPAANAMVSTMGVGLEVAISGWELDGENYNGNPIAGHGHYHVFVDGNLAGTPTTPTFFISSISAGTHTISVDLRTNNHQLLSPTVEDSVTVTAADPSITISAPEEGATVGTTVALRVQIAGFVIDPEAIGQANVPGRGHYHVAVDGQVIDFEATGTVYAVEDLAAGSHTIQVSLHNNDHSDLSPVVIDDVSVTVSVAPVGIDPAVFIGTTVGLIALLVVVAVVLLLWARRGGKGQGGGEPPT